MAVMRKFWTLRTAGSLVTADGPMSTSGSCSLCFPALAWMHASTTHTQRCLPCPYQLCLAGPSRYRILPPPHKVSVHRIQMAAPTGRTVAAKHVRPGWADGCHKTRSCRHADPQHTVEPFKTARRPPPGLSQSACCSHSSPQSRTRDAPTGCLQGAQSMDEWRREKKLQ